MAGSIIPHNPPELHLGPGGSLPSEVRTCRETRGLAGGQRESLRGAQGTGLRFLGTVSLVLGSLPPRVGPGQVQQVTTRGSARNMNKKNEGAKHTASPQLELLIGRLDLIYKNCTFSQC